MTKESGVDPGPRRTELPRKSVQGAALRAADAYRSPPAAIEIRTTHHYAWMG